jgi:salicylate hydroxylase
LWSKVRDAIHGHQVFPLETGDIAYRATFPREELEALNDEKVNELCQQNAVTSWLGPGKHAIFYPIRGGHEFNLVLLQADNLAVGSRREEGDFEGMRQSYIGWDET